MIRHSHAILGTALALTAGCATTQPIDYSAFRAHEPRSILVLPPLNETVEALSDYNWLSTATMPLAEHGYYVFPVAVVDEFMKENGLPTPGEMHAVPPSRLGEVFGADAILYVTIVEWGQKYIVLSSNTVVGVRARLVDATTSTELWSGNVRLVESSGGGNDLLVELIVAVVEQVVDSNVDRAHDLSRRANLAMLWNKTTGIPPGHRNPDHLTDPRGR